MNRDLSGTLEKPKKWDNGTAVVPKVGKAGPNVIIVKLYYFKSSFIYLRFPRAKGDKI